jgi:hypothetical protein
VLIIVVPLLLLAPTLSSDDRWILEMTIPRGLALSLAVLQMALLAAVTIRGLNSDWGARRDVSWLALLVIGASALIVARRVGGPSASVWPDTFNDQAEVQRCLENDECTVYGMGTSVPGFVHAGGWLQWRDLGSALGFSMDQQYVFLQVLDAFAVMLAAFVAWRLGGPLAAAVATYAIWNRYGSAGVTYNALYNSLPMPFLGGVLLIACVDAVERPSAAAVAAVGLVGAIVANVHFAGVTCGLTSVWIGFCAPRRRLRLAMIGGAAFALGTLVISPASWLHAIGYVLSHPGGERRETGTFALLGEPVVVDGLWLTALWALLWFGARSGPLRRRLGPMIAIIAPPLAVFLVAGLIGRINPSGKYIADIRAPVAVAFALVVAAAAQFLTRPLGSLTEWPALWRVRAGRLRRAVPYLGAVTLLAYGSGGDGPTLRLRDIDAAARVIRNDFGWDYATAVRSLKSPYFHDTLTAWKSMYPTWARGTGSSGQVDGGQTAVLLQVAKRDLPIPIPLGWRVISTTTLEATVLASVPSWIDWTRYTVCRSDGRGGAERCVESGLFDRPHQSNTIEIDAMPDAAKVEERDLLQLRLPLRAGAPGEVHEVYMPRHPSQLCSGRITAVPEGSRMDPDGRHATLVTAAAGAELVVEWNLAACTIGLGDLPPFFVEGDAKTVHPLAELMTKTWER